MNIEEKDVISYISFVLNRYIKEKKVLDKVGCDELVKSLILYNELSNYITNINYINTTDYNMSYSYFDKTININMNYINNITTYNKELLDILKIHDEIIIKNLDILHALLHEIMHARQYKIIDTIDDNLIKDILIKSLSSSKDNQNDNYIEATKDISLYSLMPSELNAEIEALKQTSIIINKLNINEKYKYNSFYELSIKLLQIRSYDNKLFKVISPIEKFIKRRNKYIKEKIIINKKDIYKYSLDERLSYGLPIKRNEYVKLDNEINNTLKDMIK